MYKIWVKFNSYTGNFEKEFVAFMFGYEGEYDKGDYKQYVSDFIKNGKDLLLLKNKLEFTYQEVDDYSEETFYNIEPYLGKGKECNGIFFQLFDKPTLLEYEKFIDRAKLFPKFLENTEEYSHLKGIKIVDMCVTKEQKRQEKIM